jgi:hypothetical protein
MFTIQPDDLRWSCRRQKEERKSAVDGLHCTERVVWSTALLQVEKHIFSLRVQKHSTTARTRAIYVCPKDNLDHDLSGIYHDELQDDKVPVSVHESPPARMSQTAPLLRTRICSLGTRHFCAVQKTACLLGVIANTT